MARSGREPPRNSQRSPVRVTSSAWSRVSMFAYSRSTPDNFACDLARADGRGIARITRHVVDHLFDFLESQPVVQRDLEVGLQFVAGPQRDQRAEGYQAAGATIEARSGPQRPENVIKAKVAEFVGDAAVAQAGDAVGDQPGQHVFEHSQPLSSVVSHGVCLSRGSRDIW